MPYDTRSAWPRPDRADWPVPGLDEMTSAWEDLAVDLATAYGSFLGGLAPDRPARRGSGSRRRHRSAKHPKSGPAPCRDCGRRCAGSCHCRCCVSDADLVVRARLGERRVVPVRIHNERQRTRTITLDLGDFTTGGGHSVPVSGWIATPPEFELEGCSEQEVILVIDSAVQDSSLEEAIEQGRLRDVDDCTVAYADLRIQGCDVRPVRIAVLLLPRDCEAYEVHCACGCC